MSQEKNLNWLGYDLTPGKNIFLKPGAGFRYNALTGNNVALCPGGEKKERNSDWHYNLTYGNVRLQKNSLLKCHLGESYEHHEFCMPGEF